MLTGARPGEAMRATWTEFDEPGYWGKPAAHTKQRKRHRVPLSPAASELVAKLRRKRADDEFVFPGRIKGRPLRELRGVWEEVTRAAGLEGALVYTLATFVRSVGAGGGLSLQIIGKLLGHTVARTTEKYAHLADDPLREAAAKIGARSPGPEGRGQCRHASEARRRMSARADLGLPDWLRPQDYPKPQGPGEMESWAWQFLRRNHEFREFWLTKVKPFMLADERVRSDWPHQEEMWSKFGIRRLQSPRQEDCMWPPPFFTWNGPGPPRALWPPPYNTNSSERLELSEYEMPVIIDFRLPLDDQLKAIESTCEALSMPLKETNRR